MNTKVNLLIFEPYPMGLGGNYITQNLIIKYLDPVKFNIVVVSPIEGIVLDRFRKRGIECLVIAPPQSLQKYGRAILSAGLWNRIISSWNLISYNLQIARFIKMRNINLVYSNCVRAQLCVGFAALLMRIPSLIYVKGALENPIIDRLCYLISTKILFFCAANRDDHYQFLNKLFKKKIDILEIGLDLNLIDRIQLLTKEHIRSELDINPNNLNCVVLGQLYEPKGQHIAITALAKLVESHPNIRLYIVGDHVISEYKEYRLKLDNLISQLGLEGNVCFTGWRSDALEIVNVMDLVVHPSFAEGFGRAVLEAMALGKPVIASAVGGLREAIKTGENGYLFPPGDIDYLAQFWMELASDQGLRLDLGSKARETVYLKYSAEQKVQKLANIFLSMMRSSRKKCVE